MKKFNKNLLLLVALLFLASCNNNSNVSDSSQTSGNEISQSSVEENDDSNEISQSSEEENDDSSEISNSDEVNESSSEEAVFVDYVSQTKLDLTDSSKITAEVEVLHYVDGDTTHFVPVGTPSVWIEDDYLKARYNSVDTPESTGKVEKWGKSASLFTKDALESAQSIILQSDTNTWNTDTTGGRYLVWVWYRVDEHSDYRLLNLELIQNGLAKLKSASSYSLYDTFYAANLQAMNLKLKLYSNDKDPNYYDGNAISLSMKELRLNASEYKDKKVCVEGLVTLYDPFNHMAYAESYDAEDDRWYGMNFYAGYTKFAPLASGNYLRLVGTLSFYAPDSNSPEYGTWQVSGLAYLPMTPDYEGSMKILEKNVEVVAHEVTYDDLSTRIENEGDTLSVGEKIESTYVTMNNLLVTKVYTTQSTNINSNGALTLTCKDNDGNVVTVRTSVLKHDDDTLLTAEEVLNKNISVKGIVTKYNGKIQIHVFTLNELEIA
ncbi:MAG: thermonuclease family protein [Erysipelotrichaceae bacterium]|nr:thermonuclease family protein [Erysipelotrichaceae bacterium]